MVLQNEVSQEQLPVPRWRSKRFLRAGVVLLFGALIAVMTGYATPGLLEWLYQKLRPVDAQNLPPFTGLPMGISVAAASILGFFLGALVINILIGVLSRLLEHWDNMDSGDKVTLFLGIFTGLIASVPFIFLFNTIFTRFYVPLSILAVTIGFMTLAVYALQSMSEILPWTKAKAKGRRKHIKILDTNVIIDGRIYDLARTGFLEGQLYVPGFVLEELQYIADSHDPLRRQRGRRGLDVLRHLQADFQLEIRNQDKVAPDLGDGVDSRLVRLARAMGADIVTNDFNLNRVAVLQDVNVLNINDLALSLRPNVLPQEKLPLTIVREGNQPGQGVGYLEDGTMVVVENGRPHLGETVEVTVTQVIQTERGKMIFGEVDPEDENGHNHDDGHGRRPRGNGGPGARRH